MSLSYNQTCPTRYQPHGFVDTDDFQEEDVAAVCDSLGTAADDTVGMFETGHHQVRITASVSSSDAQDSSIDPQDTEMSKHLQAMQKTSSNYSNNLVSTLRGSTPAVKRRADSPSWGGKRARPNALEPAQKFTASSLKQATDLRSSQSLVVSGVAKPESAHDTQSPPLSVVAPKKSSEEAGTRLVVTKLAELLVHCHAIQSGRVSGEQDVFVSALLAEGTIKRLNRGSFVSCECGNQHRANQMVSCGLPWNFIALTPSAVLRGLQRLAASRLLWEQRRDKLNHRC